MKNFILVVVLLLNIGMIFFGMKSLVASDGFSVKISMMQNDLKAKESSLLAERKNLEELQKKFNDLETVKVQVQKELTSKKEEAADLARQLAREKHTRVDLERKLKNAETQIHQLEGQVQQEKDKNKQLEERLQRMADRLEKQEGDKEALLSRLNSSIKERDTLKDQLQKMDSNTQKYTLAEITVSEQKKYSGLILNVNDKYNFCIVSIGKSDGIVSGIELVVHRGSALIGKIVVEKVFDRMSSAKIISLSENQTIQVEDKVRKF